MFDFNQGTGFDWDQGNSDKNWIRHQVTRQECQAVFYNRPLVLPSGIAAPEQRYYAIGETDGGRRLFVVFIIRGDLVRVISARDMSRRERQMYEQS